MSVKKRTMTKCVRCRECGGIHFSCTKDYRAKDTAHAGMIKMLPKYVEYGWEQPQDPTAGYGVLECPECGAALAPNGFFKVVQCEFI
jgi:hypothetical protein